MSLTPTEARLHRQARQALKEVALAADVAADPNRSGLSPEARKTLADVSCI
ncbi:unnamed protein product, partial [Symbiodinium pilosum]